jgi:hypothetical protein
MPLVTRRAPRDEANGGQAAVARAGSLFPRCSNPRCATGWVHLWRSRRIPAFEGKWACSAECMRELVAAAVRRAMDGGDAGGLVHPHRLPMGLTLVEQGKITARQLREALEGQRRAAEEGGERMRLGEWLLKSGVLGEPALTRALGAQWNCPVFSLDGYRPQELASALPRFLSDALGALPVRAPGGTQLHVAFSGRVDRTLSYALERMTGLKVVAGVARDSEFVAAQGRYLASEGPRARFLEAASSRVLVRTLANLIETEKPVEARLARVHDYYWLRLWRRTEEGSGLASPDAVEDLLATLGGATGSPGRINQISK